MEINKQDCRRSISISALIRYWSKIGSHRLTKIRAESHLLGRNLKSVCNLIGQVALEPWARRHISHLSGARRPEAEHPPFTPERYNSLANCRVIYQSDLAVGIERGSACIAAATLYRTESTAFNNRSDGLSIRAATVSRAAEFYS